MSYPSNVRRVAGALLAVAFTACGRTDAPRYDTGVELVPLDTVESFGALASRREAQSWLDAAREAVGRRKLEDAAIALSDAATFLQSESRTATGDARPALERAAEQLDSLAGVVAHGVIRSPNALDRVFANVHAAEASFTCSAPTRPWYGERAFVLVRSS